MGKRAKTIKRPWVQDTRVQFIEAMLGNFDILEHDANDLRRLSEALRLVADGKRHVELVERIERLEARVAAKPVSPVNVAISATPAATARKALRRLRAASKDPNFARRFAEIANPKRAKARGGK